MDEKIIYIIFIVLSLVYSIYKKKQKQAAAGSRQSTAGSQQTTAKSEKSISEQKRAERTETIKSLIDKMLLGEEFTAASTTKDQPIVEKEAEVISDIIPQTYIFHDDLNVKKTNEPELRKNETIKTETIPHRYYINFNLKQAVINSVILERKY